MYQLNHRLPKVIAKHSMTNDEDRHVSVEKKDEKAKDNRIFIVSKHAH